MEESLEEKAWREFVDALEGLKRVHTREQLERQKRRVERARKRLLQVSPEFRRMVEENARRARLESERRIASYRRDYEAYMRLAEELRNPKDGVIVPQMVGSGMVLACPQCLSTTVGWRRVNRRTRRRLKLPRNVREIPWCFKCGRRMVEMPRSVLENLRRMRNAVG